MSKNTSTTPSGTTPVVKEKATRKMLTTAERIAKAEAELVALRERAEAKTAKQVIALKAKLEGLKTQRATLNSKIDALTVEIAGLEGTADTEIPGI